MSNRNPVVASGGLPEPESVPGHIVCGQLLIMVNEYEKEQEKNVKRMSKLVRFQDDFVGIFKDYCSW